MRQTFVVTEDEDNGATVEFLDASGHRLYVSIEKFLSMFGNAAPSSVEDLKSRDPEDQRGWHQHFDAWGSQGILPL